MESDLIIAEREQALIELLGPPPWRMWWLWWGGDPVGGNPRVSFGIRDPQPGSVVIDVWADEQPPRAATFDWPPEPLAGYDPPAVISNVRGDGSVMVLGGAVR
jgi:hypothetical protein